PFTASSSVPAIYIQQFWNTMTYDEKLGFTVPNLMNNGSQKNLFKESRRSSLTKTAKRRQLLSSFLTVGDDFLLGNLKFVLKGERDEVFGMDIPTHLITAIRNSPYYQQYMNLVAKEPKAKEGVKKKTVSEAVRSEKPAPVKQTKPASAKQPKSPKKKPFKITPSRKNHLMKVPYHLSSEEACFPLGLDMLSRKHWPSYELHEELSKFRKRRQDDQDPPPPPNDEDHDPPPLKDSEQNKKKKMDSDASASTQPHAHTSLTWTTTDTRDTPSSSSKQQQTSPSGGPTEDVPIPDEVHNSDTEDTENAHLPKITTTADWFRPIPKEERPATPEPEWSIPPNDFPEADNSWANAFATTYQDPEENKLLRKIKILWICVQEKISRDVLTVGSTMRIPLLYRGEYLQWVEFMNYLEEQTDGKAMINSIKHSDQQLPRITQVPIAGTSSTKQPPLKDKSMWSDQEKKIQKTDRLARSLLIQGLPNDIFSLIDSNKTAKDL
nr:hypothetical protein [Tanacetum cinerariifolium]